MKSLWSDPESAQYPGDLGQRVYTSRLLGAEPSLVLHGGGNTSVKVREPNLFGRGKRGLGQQQSQAGSADHVPAFSSTRSAAQGMNSRRGLGMGSPEMMLMP